MAPALILGYRHHVPQPSGVLSPRCLPWRGRAVLLSSLSDGHHLAVPGDSRDADRVVALGRYKTCTGCAVGVRRARTRAGSGNGSFSRKSYPATRLLIRSGWLVSTPQSRTATTMFGSPVVISHASGARMSAPVCRRTDLCCAGAIAWGSTRRSGTRRECWRLVLLKQSVVSGQQQRRPAQLGHRASAGMPYSGTPTRPQAAWLSCPTAAKTASASGPRTSSRYSCSVNSIRFLIRQAAFSQRACKLFHLRARLHSHDDLRDDRHRFAVG